MKIPNITEASIDFSTICQLRCVECSTAKGITHKGIVGKGQLRFVDSFNFVNDNPQIRRIEMSNWGEIFLNPDMEEILKYAYEHNVKLYCGNGTNFNTIEDNVLEALVKYKVEFLNISIDGATQETYEQYRIGGKLKNVIQNIERLNYYKRLYSSEYPKLSWQFVIFGHNEHEIPQVKELCKKFDMAFNPKLNYSNFSPVRDKVYVRRESGLSVADRKEFKETFKKEYKAPCYHCFISPQINWNGDILGCSVNKWRIMGNAFITSISDWEKSDYFQNLVDVLFCGKECTPVIPCYYCPNYNKIKDNPLSSNGLQEYIDYVPPALKNK